MGKKTGRVGEKRTMNNGMEATIITYRSSRNVDVQFKDGWVRNNVQYSHFIRGNVSHPKVDTKSVKKASSRVGETRTMNNGIKAIIIAYRSYHDIDVQFENGYIKKCVHYLNFTRGQVTCPGQDTQKVNRKTYRVGESKKMSNGMEATIIAYRSNTDIDVRFEDGQEKSSVFYNAFIKGYVAHPSGTEVRHIGETRIMSNGMSATIITYRSYADMDVQFEDGQRRNHISYSVFSKGYVAHPDKIKRRRKINE